MEDNFVKITNAVYRLLEFFPENDPLKNRAKEKALEILANSRLVFENQGWISLKKYLSPEREKFVERLLENIEILESYLKIGKNQGWISDMNLLIVIKEYESIKKRSYVKKVVPEPVEFLGKIQNIHADKGSKIILETEKRISQIIEKKSIGQSIYSDRQQKILKMLNKNGKGQVSDIIKELPDVTKRTIRRDLDDLLKKEKIVRIGDYNQVSYQIK